MRSPALLALGALVLAGALLFLRAERAPSSARTAAAVGAPRDEVRSRAALQATVDGVAEAPEATVVGAASTGGRTAAEVEGTAPAAAVDAATEERAHLVVFVHSSDTGRPVRDVRVLLGDAKTRHGAHVDRSFATIGEVPRSDDLGRVQFEVPSGVELELRLDPYHGLPLREVPPLAQGETRAEQFLVPTAPDLRFHVRVVRGEDATPIAGAEVRLESVPGAGGGIAARAITDEDGRAFIEAKSADVRGGLVIAEGRAPAVFAPGRAERPEDALVVPLHLPARIVGNVSGDVTDLGVRVEMAPGSGHHFAHALWTGFDSHEVLAHVDPTGSFRLDGLVPRAEIDLSLLRGGRSLRHEKGIVLEPGEERHVEFHLGSGATIEGVASEVDGQPVVGLRIWLVRGDDSKQLYSFQEPHARATTDEAGSFAFDDVGPGDWRIGPAPSTQGVPAATERVEVPPGAARVRAELEINRSLYIDGTVLDPEGAPAGSAHVFAVTDGGFFENTESNDEGRFRIGPLPPGSCSIGAETQDAVGEAVRARAGDEDVVLRLQAGGSITGRVLDEKGNLCSAQVLFASSLADLRAGNLGAMIF